LFQYVSKKPLTEFDFNGFDGELSRIKSVTGSIISIAKDGQDKEKISNAFNQLQLSAAAYSLGVRAAISGEKKETEVNPKLYSDMHVALEAFLTIIRYSNYLKNPAAKQHIPDTPTSPHKGEAAIVPPLTPMASNSGQSRVVVVPVPPVIHTVNSPRGGSSADILNNNSPPPEEEIPKSPKSPKREKKHKRHKRANSADIRESSKIVSPRKSVADIDFGKELDINKKQNNAIAQSLSDSSALPTLIPHEGIKQDNSLPSLDSPKDSTALHSARPNVPPLNFENPGDSVKSQKRRQTLQEIPSTPTGRRFSLNDTNSSISLTSPRSSPNRISLSTLDKSLDQELVVEPDILATKILYIYRAIKVVMQQLLREIDKDPQREQSLMDMVLQFSIHSKNFLDAVIAYVENPTNEGKKLVETNKQTIIRDVSVAATVTAHRGSIIKSSLNDTNRCILCTAILSQQDVANASNGSHDMLCATCVKLMNV